MAIIWGFNLSEMSWSAFGHKKMFDKRWHLRRERFIAYQLAMLICLAAECTATYSLSKYDDLQTHVKASALASGPTRPHLHKIDLKTAEVLTIVFCVFVATLFGADFFFLLFFPRRVYPQWYNVARKALAVWITLGVLSGALMSSVVVARSSAFITGVDDATQLQLVRSFHRPPLKYNAYSVNIAYIVLTWIGFICTAASTVLMFMAAKYDALHGADPAYKDGDKDREGASGIGLKEGGTIARA